MPRRILFYTHAFGGGGAEVVFGRLARAFAEAGDEVIFAADFAGPFQVRDQTNLRHELLGASHATSTSRLSALLRAQKPDASFSALGAQNLKHFAAALTAGRLDRCVLGFHGFAVSEAKLFSRACFWASPIVTRLAPRTICVSDALLETMQRKWHASRRRTVRIYNPVPEPTDAAASLGLDTPPLIVGCGRLVDGKRFGDLIAAFAGVRPSTARLAILGAGPELDRLRAEVDRLALGDRVELPGHVEDPSPWYRRASCVAISSESESFGLTAAEALMHGTPVVTTACGGPVEILGHGRFGQVVPVGDVQALSTALTRALADPGAEGPRRERAADFSIETIHGAYSRLIESLSIKDGLTSYREGQRPTSAGTRA